MYENEVGISLFYAKQLLNENECILQFKKLCTHIISWNILLKLFIKVFIIAFSYIPLFPLFSVGYATFTASSQHAIKKENGKCLRIYIYVYMWYNVLGVNTLYIISFAFVLFNILNAKLFIFPWLKSFCFIPF